MQITSNKVVKIDYTLTDDDGEIIDTSEGHDPLEYLHGVGGIIPGLELALEGKAVGDTFKISVQPDDAYGEHDAGLMHEVDRTQFEASMTLNWECNSKSIRMMVRWSSLSSISRMIKSRSTAIMSWLVCH